MTNGGWASPAGSQDDAFWRRPENAETGNGALPPSETVTYSGPPAMSRPTAGVGWGPVISPGPVPRSLPPQDHDALDLEDAQARAVTVGVGVLTLVVLFLLLLMIVIRAGTATANL
jgi:hypothetical protein